MQTDHYIRPRQLAQAIGVSESSLKRWTDRGLLPTVKTVGGHRRLPLWGVIHFLRSTGHPLVKPQLLGLPAPMCGPDAKTLDACLPTFLGMLLAGDVTESKELVLRTYVQGHSLADLSDCLFRPAMEEIGRQWQAGAIDVYHEHRATQVLLRVLGRLRSILRPAKDDAPVALGAAPSNDPYVLSTSMAELVLLGRGWRATNLGPNTPLASLARAITDLEPRLVWLSFSSPSGADSMPADYEAVADAAASVGAGVMVGGRGVTPELRERLHASMHGERLGSLVAFADTLLAAERRGRSGTPTDLMRSSDPTIH